jgi:hypothetical protein
MKHRIRASLVAVCAVAALAVQACGAGPDGTPARQSTNPTSPPPFGHGAEEAEGELSACATSTATADAKPVHLVIMFDRSGSMDEGGRWNACTAATEAFLESDASRGMSASLHYFPPVATGDAMFLGCKPDVYAKPAVARTQLPSRAFRESLSTTRAFGGTPTKPALEGAVQYARIVAREGDAKVAIVLVTDGEPTDCSSDVRTVSAVAADVSASIPTYVVGVGDLASLDTIAVSGGTKKAILVDAKDPARIERDLLAAIGRIKSQVLACDYSIPAPPKGETFERGKVNVIHRPESGEKTILRYSPSCAKGAGWRYDDENAPTRIVICEESCKTLEATPGSVEVLFGCATKSTDVK